MVPDGLFFLEGEGDNLWLTVFSYRVSTTIGWLLYLCHFFWNSVYFIFVWQCDVNPTRLVSRFCKYIDTSKLGVLWGYSIHDIGVKGIDPRVSPIHWTGSSVSTNHRLHPGFRSFHLRSQVRGLVLRYDRKTVHPLSLLMSLLSRGRVVSTDCNTEGRLERTHSDPTVPLVGSST